MGWAYNKDFEPLALVGENLILYYNGKEEYYLVKRIHSLPPFIYRIGDSLSAGASVTKSLKDYEPEGFNTIYHLRLVPIDDVKVLVKSPATVPLWAIHNTTVAVTSPNKRHTAYHSISASGTPELLYKISQNRSARVKKLVIIGAGSAGTVFLCDSGGTAISPPFYVGANEVKSFDETTLPEIEAWKDIYVQSSVAGVSVFIEVEEVDADYMPRFTDIIIAKAKAPTLEITNPTQYDLDDVRIQFFGYTYIVEPLKEKPAKFTHFSASR